MFRSNEGAGQGTFGRMLRPFSSLSRESEKKLHKNSNEEEQPEYHVSYMQLALRTLGFEYWSLLMITYAYCAAGAAMFYYSEKDAEDNYIKHVEELYANTTAKMAQGVYNQATKDCGTEHIWNKTAIQETIKKYYSYDEYWKPRKMWTYFGAVNYCFSLLTTIGSGVVNCFTDTGKILSIPYCVFGIPLFLAAISRFGGILFLAVETPWRYLAAHAAHDQPSNHRAPVGLYVLIVVVCLLVAAGIDVFILDEPFVMYAPNSTTPDKLFTAAYFDFNYLSTIGLGDVPPTDTAIIEPKSVSGIILTTVFLSLVGVIYSILQLRMQDTHFVCKCPGRKEPASNE